MKKIEGIFQTHCKRGHALHAKNVCINSKTGARACLLCSSIRQRYYRSIRPVLKKMHITGIAGSLCGVKNATIESSANKVSCGSCKRVAMFIQRI